ncbi:MAG: hypothetical protein LKF52_15035 [Butyrivibrio sp.]|nr:hypothetical protein [Butyrivibrio sp.]
MTDILILVIIAITIYLSYRKNKLKMPGTRDSTMPHHPATPKANVPRTAASSNSKEKTPQYIVHTELEDGYMNLNGVRVKIKDADKLEW